LWIIHVPYRSHWLGGGVGIKIGSEVGGFETETIFVSESESNSTFLRMTFLVCWLEGKFSTWMASSVMTIGKVWVVSVSLNIWLMDGEVIWTCSI